MRRGRDARSFRPFDTRRHVDARSSGAADTPERRDGEGLLVAERGLHDEAALRVDAVDFEPGFGGARTLGRGRVLDDRGGRGVGVILFVGRAGGGRRHGRAEAADLDLDGNGHARRAVELDPPSDDLGPVGRGRAEFEDGLRRRRDEGEAVDGEVVESHL